ncbi:MAG: hypothetical protein QXN55_01605 [Candidatus Nitrosotenuis sp.]
MRRLIFDTANVLFRVAAAHGKYSSGTPEEKAGLAMHVSLNVFLKYFRMFQPDQIALTFEGVNNWRKEYTKSAACVSKRVYKANRVKDPAMEPYFALMKSFERLVREHTSLVCLSAPEVEGDDLFAGYVQRFTEEGDEVIGISGDKDFVQLLKHPKFRLINPDDGKDRVCADPLLFMFEKCMRGDAGDNVMSAYPRVRKTRLEKAYNDEYELIQLMQEQWQGPHPTDPEQTLTFKVQDLFIENILLMDLEAQPAHIRDIIRTTLDYELANHGKFSLFHFQKFLGKYDLRQISDNVMQYVDMFSVTDLRSPHRKVEQSPIVGPTTSSAEAAIIF